MVAGTPGTEANSSTGTSVPLASRAHGNFWFNAWLAELIRPRTGEFWYVST